MRTGHWFPGNSLCLQSMSDPGCKKTLEVIRPSRGSSQLARDVSFAEDMLLFEDGSNRESSNRKNLFSRSRKNTDPKIPLGLQEFGPTSGERELLAVGEHRHHRVGVQEPAHAARVGAGRRGGEQKAVLQPRVSARVGLT